MPPKCVAVSGSQLATEHVLEDVPERQEFWLVQVLGYALCFCLVLTFILVKGHESHF